METEMRNLKLKPLKDAHASGVAPTRAALVSVLNEPTDAYGVAELEFLFDYLKNGDDSTKTQVIRILGRYGALASDIAPLLENPSNKIRNEVMRVAETQGDADTIVDMVLDDASNVHDAIFRLRRLGKTDHLIPFLFSDDEQLVELVKLVTAEGGER